MGRMRFDRVPVGAWMALGRSVGGAINAGNAPEAEIQQERTQLSETNAPGKDMVYDEDTGQYVQGYLDQSTPSGLSSTGDAQQNAKVKDPPVDVKTQTPTFKSVGQYGLGGEWRDKEYTPKEVKRYNDNRSIDYWKKKGEFGIDMVKSLRADQTAEDSQVLHEIQTEAARGQLAEQKRASSNREELGNISKEGEEELQKFNRGEGLPGNTPDLIRIGNNNKLVATLMAQGNIKDANELRKVNEQYASGVGLAALNRGDLGTVGTLMSNHSGRKYENLATAKGGDGETYITGTIDGKPFQMPERNAYNELAAIAFPGQVYNDKFNFANKNADLKREAMFLAALLKGNNTGGGGSRGSVGTRAASSKTGDGEQGGYLGIPGIKTQEDFDKFVNHSMGGPEGTPVVMDAKGKPVEGVNRQDYRERFSRIATDLATGGNNLPPGVLADVTHRMVRNGYAGGGIKQDIDVSKDGEARRVVTIDGRMYNLGGKLSDGEAIDFLERSYSGPPEQKAVAIEKFRVDKEYARATSTAKEFAVLDGGGSVADKNGTKLTKQAIINSMGGGEEGLQRYNEAKDAANTLAELATTKYQEFRAKHVDEGRRGGVKPNPASATTERNTGRRDTVWSPGGFPKIVPGVNGKAGHIDWSPLTRRVEDKGYPQ